MNKAQARTARMSYLLQEIKSKNSQMSKLSIEAGRKVFFEIDAHMKDLFIHIHAATLEGCKVVFKGSYSSDVEIATLGNRDNLTWVHYSSEPKASQTWSGANLVCANSVDVIQVSQPDDEMTKSRIQVEASQCVCCDCGTYADNLQSKCPACGSTRVVVANFCNTLFGSDWYNSSFGEPT